MNFIYYKSNHDGKWKLCDQSLSLEKLISLLMYDYFGSSVSGFSYLLIKEGENWKFDYMEKNGGIQHGY